MNAPLPESVRKAIESVSLDDKYSLERGSAFMSGVQALVRLPMLQRQHDRAGQQRGPAGRRQHGVAGQQHSVQREDDGKGAEQVAPHEAARVLAGVGENGRVHGTAGPWASVPKSAVIGSIQGEVQPAAVRPAAKDARVAWAALRAAAANSLPRLA